jgi:hypothetical protein
MKQIGYEDPSRTKYKQPETISDKDMMGNRGLNTQQVMDGIETRCVGRQDKTNGKWKMDQWWLEDEHRPNKERQRLRKKSWQAVNFKNRFNHKEVFQGLAKKGTYW